MRTTEYTDCYGPELDALAEEVRELVLEGSAEICPNCAEVSAYCWADCTSGESDRPFWKPQSGTVAYISCASGYEFRCGHCGANCCAADSPINASVYTHAED